MKYFKTKNQSILRKMLTLFLNTSRALVQALKIFNIINNLQKINKSKIKSMIFKNAKKSSKTI
jgi:hypothetical protein